MRPSIKQWNSEEHSLLADQIYLGKMARFKKTMTLTLSKPRFSTGELPFLSLNPSLSTEIRNPQFFHSLMRIRLLYSVVGKNGLLRP
jgi:hypothetical protein